MFFTKNTGRFFPISNGIDSYRFFREGFQRLFLKFTLLTDIAIRVFCLKDKLDAWIKRLGKQRNWKGGETGKLELAFQDSKIDNLLFQIPTAASLSDSQPHYLSSPTNICLCFRGDRHKYQLF